jgi:hypothetical protein
MALASPRRPGSPLMTSADLDDPGQFVTIRGVPLLDAHDHPEKGNVDERLLRLLALNSNARSASGNPPAVIAGHTRRKVSMVVVRPDGSRIELPGSSEEQQPPVLGFVTGFRVEPYQGRPCIHADLRIRKEHADTAKSYPFRSVERVQPQEGDRDETQHFIDRVALLRSPPERDLGIVRYERSDGAPARELRICYERSPARGNVPSHHIPPIRRTPPMSAHARRIAYEAAADLLDDIIIEDAQRAEAQKLRQEGFALDDQEVESMAALDPVSFDRAADRVRKRYSRRQLSTFERQFGSSDHTAFLSRAVAFATRHGCSLDEAKGRLQAGEK